MPREKASAEPTYGFLSTLETPEYGFFGGYLIVSRLGRPLEFHCTSPVRPSRAQEILYGPTLQPYLIGEQISSALLKAAKFTPCLVLVDAEVLLAARSHANVPFAWVAQQGRSDLIPTDDDGIAPQHVVAFDRRESRSQVGPIDATTEAGGYGLILPSGFHDEKHVVAECAMQLSQYVDLSEPFGRIHEAIREAQRIGARAHDAHGQAA
jgi:hypothetical protein